MAGAELTCPDWLWTMVGVALVYGSFHKPQYIPVVVITCNIVDGSVMSVGVAVLCAIPAMTI